MAPAFLAFDFTAERAAKQCVALQAFVRCNARVPDMAAPCTTTA